MSTTRIFKNMLIGSAISSFFGGFSGALGVQILEMFGCTNCNSLEVMEVGMVGNAIIGAATHLASGCANKIILSKQSVLLSTTAISFGLTTLAGPLGYSILSTFTEMSLEKTVAALAAGSSTLIACGVIGLTLGGLCSVVSSKVLSSTKPLPATPTIALPTLGTGLFALQTDADIAITIKDENELSAEENSRLACDR